VRPNIELARAANLRCNRGILVDDTLLTYDPAEALRKLKAPVLALNGGAVGQHSCGSLMEKVGGSTNEVDFSLNLASAAQAKCLDIHHLAPSDNDPHGHMVQTTKVPLR
jgi:hypothetical protein